MMKSPKRFLLAAMILSFGAQIFADADHEELRQQLEQCLAGLAQLRADHETLRSEYEALRRKVNATVAPAVSDELKRAAKDLIYRYPREVRMDGTFIEVTKKVRRVLADYFVSLSQQERAAAITDALANPILSEAVLRGADLKAEPLSAAQSVLREMSKHRLPYALLLEHIAK